MRFDVLFFMKIMRWSKKDTKKDKTFLKEGERNASIEDGGEKWHYHVKEGLELLLSNLLEDELKV